MKDPKKFRQYIETIAQQHGGLEGLRDLVQKAPLKAPARRAKTLESVEDGEDTKQTAVAGLESIEQGRLPGVGQQAALEAIIDEDLRPAFNIKDGQYNADHWLWKDLNDARIKERLSTAFKSIGRVELPGTRIPYGGTGFVVGDGLVMTNRHVAELFASGLGTRATLKLGAHAGLDFLKEFEQTKASEVFEVTGVEMIHPYWDMALLRVPGVGRNGAHLTLGLKDSRDLKSHRIVVVGYPAFDPRNAADAQAKVFGQNYGIKRLQPGMLQGGMGAASFGKLVAAATHDCSTLGGNSGSALLDPSTDEVAVLALHFGGRYHEQNYAVPSSELARDARVVDAGVQFVGKPSPGTTDWDEWWRDVEMTNDSQADGDTQSTSAEADDGQASPPSNRNVATFEIPLRVSISIGAGKIVGAAVSGTGATGTEAEGLEAMVEPAHDTNYSTRKGYDPKFLNGGLNGNLAPVTVPMPKAADAAVVAKTLKGEDVLHYQNFSIIMHAKRRLALVTASNVTEEKKLRKPEPGKNYTRKGLSELGKNDIEKWFLDPRLKPEFQLPDVFFTNDRKAFDKGHVVRRDDVAWGSTALKRANGDSYHVTNCSPQVSTFNQSQKGEDNWGDLENDVLSQSASERLCVFAGPILAKNDQVFTGAKVNGVSILARIPARFWKVIVARVEDGLASYGFVLKQDLSDVDWEFVPDDAFVPNLKRLKDIAKLAGIVFDQALLDADQFDSVRGLELVQLGKAKLPSDDQ